MKKSRPDGTMRELKLDGIRFLLGGLSNAVLTFAIYQLALMFFGPKLAYCIAWACGLLFVVWVYPDRVFIGGKSDASARIRLGASYLIIFILGLLALELFHVFGVSPRISIIFVMAFTTLINFLAGRFVLRR